eukprot:6892950-Karenia_brevis.AAC.1
MLLGRSWLDADIGLYARPCKQTVEIIQQNKYGLVGFHAPDIMQCKRIEGNYINGTIHYALPWLLHYNIISTGEANQVLNLHDDIKPNWKHDLRRMTAVQGKALHQILARGYNSTRPSHQTIVLYE